VLISCQVIDREKGKSKTFRNANADACKKSGNEIRICKAASDLFIFV